MEKIFFLVLLITSGVNLLLLLFPLPRYFYDTVMSGIQKMHTDPRIPRVGGAALLIGMIIGLGYSQPTHWFPLIILFGLAFLTGLIEDIRKNIRPLYRLLLSFSIALLAIWLLKLGFYRSGSQWIDVHFLKSPFLAYPIAMVMIGGVMHALNIIDGYNGLMPTFAAFAATALAFIALKVGDLDVAIILIMLVAALLGMLFFNYPWGKIFMGDGGAYLVGFILSLCSLSLVNNNPQVSPWLPLAILAYPVWETLFSIYRRIVILKKSPGEPDEFNAHFIVHRYILSHSPSFPVLSHNLVSPVLCSLSLFSILPSLYYWNNTPALIIMTFLFILLYLTCYFFLFSREKKLNN